MNTKSNELAGLILAGGESSRMGIPKHELIFHNQRQDVHLFKLLQKYLTKVYISGTLRQHEDSDMKLISDQFDFRSPLNGILSALNEIKTTALLVLPADMPEIDQLAIELLISGRNVQKHVTCFYNPAIPGPEPLFAIWEPSVKKLMQDYVIEGKRSVKGLIEQVSVELLEPPNDKIFTNINTREEYQNWLKSKLIK
jgi:molybdopterin-guanine dinucleotide biosynthesis protein A